MQGMSEGSIASGFVENADAPAIVQYVLSLFLRGQPSGQTLSNNFSRMIGHRFAVVVEQRLFRRPLVCPLLDN